ncbi:MAG: lamin tail domain-containing protein [Verrucomicrobiota bacterium]
MRFSPGSFLSLFFGLLFSVSLSAQTPRLHLKFDGNLGDSSTAGVITSISVNGFTPTYTSDRKGQSAKALLMPGSGSLQLLAAALPGNSNEALGLRNAAGTNISAYTLAGWVYFEGVGAGQGYNTLFGNLGSGAGTLHAGLGLNSDKAHFGFEGNDANGTVGAITPGIWFHMVFVYNPAENSQRIYINGIPEIKRTGVISALKPADLLVGNWASPTDAGNDLRGAIDDVVVFDVALNLGQIHALYDGVDPNTLPANYSLPKLPGVRNTEGHWGVREIKAYPAIAYGTLLNADRIIHAYANTPGGTVAEYQLPVLNLSDDQAAGKLGNFLSEGDFGLNTPADDDQFVLIAKGTIRITAEDDYTLGFLGDDGARLRVFNKTFTTAVAIGGSTGNPAVPANQGDALYYTTNVAAGGNSGTMGVVHLTPGDYNLELTYWEATGGASIEVFAAKGAKTAFDSTFQLIGNTAAGGLPLVRDPDTLPQIALFSVNDKAFLSINAGTPSSFTLAWQTNAIPTAVTIDQGIGSVAQSGSLTLPSPAQTTTYTITAANGADTVTRSVTVYVDARPRIAAFAASSTTIRSGTAVTLSWAVEGAESVLLQPNNVPVAAQGSLVVNPTVETIYTLVANNGNGTDQKSLTVAIGAAPLINVFAALDPNPLYGAETSLTWEVSGADTLSINQGIGTVGGPAGSVSIVPIQTTAYTLTATNAFGTSTRVATVNQPTPIGVASPGFTVRRVSATPATPFPFAGQGYLQSADNLLAGQNAQPGTTITVTGVPTINYSNGADGDFKTGNADFPGGGAGDNFAVRISATLVVNTPGEYVFVVNSDDGARLRIDGKDVMVDESTHSPGSNSSRVTLTKATAQLELVYYDVNGGAEVELGWIRPNLSFQLLGVIAPAAPDVRGKLLISEFMAENSGESLVDEENVSSDWIEIWNSSNAPVNLSGYYLTDDAARPDKWALPAWTLGPNNYLIVFASTQNRLPPQAVAGQDNPGTLAQPHLHSNFRLSKGGGYLALTQSNGAGGFDAVSSFAPTYPPQLEAVSYGSSDAEGYIGFMEVPTPGHTNAATVAGFVSDTAFSHKRGHYNTPFPLAITTSTPGAQIRYTLDGSTPTVNRGTLYTAPISITGTTVVRAAAFKPGWKPANVDTETYLFINDIVNQTTATATARGFPNVGAGANGQVFRYGLAIGNVTAGGGSLASLKNALAAAPTLCLTTDIANLVSSTTGIYVNPGEHGLFWERPASVEYINTAGTSEFQIDCGVRIRGGASRAVGNPKHAFHLYFRNSLYDGDLEYRLFGTAGASQFSQIDLRCEQNNSWSNGGSTQNALIREEWARQTQAEMRQPYARNGYFHLYLNGIYWGVYNFEERTESTFGETYLGGDNDNFDVVKSAGSTGGYNTEMTDGNFAAWRSLFDQCLALKNDASESGRTAKFMRMQGLNPDGSRNPAFPVLLDVDNLVDYLLVVYYDGSFDSPMSTFITASNNWFGLRDRLGARGFVFFAHDHEHGMNSTGTESYNRVGPWGGSGANNWGQNQYGSRETFAKSNPHYYHELLAFSAEYRARFADRVQRHFFNGGALTTEKALARVSALSAQIDPIIHAEAARWGSTSLHRNTWIGARSAINAFVNNGGSPAGGQTTFPTQPRTTLVLAQLKGYQDPKGTAKALFPALSAPLFSGPFGGAVSKPFLFTISNPNASGTLYYSVNGADPRPVGGGAPNGALTGASPLAVTLNSTSTVRARVYDSVTQQWSALTEADYLVGTLASASNLVVSKLHYHPATAQGLEEFIEVMNIGAQTIDLTRLAFTIGVQFEFPAGFLLAPGERAVVVREMAAFTAAYPDFPIGKIAGVFANETILNNDGERLLLLDAAGGTLRDFTYDTKSPWPGSPDGDGPALVLIRPETNPDPGVGANWRPSGMAGGTPGQADSLGYAAWSGLNNLNDASGAGDGDGDGFSNIAEYALGLNPSAASNLFLPVPGNQIFGALGEFLTVTFRRTLGRDEAGFFVEATSDLLTWSPAVVVGSPDFNGDGTETLTYRHPDPRSTHTKQFLRLRVIRLP